MDEIKGENLSWVEIDLKALAHNIGQIRRRVGDEVRIMAAVKANAYGHGAISCSKTLLAGGADLLAVSNIHEAMKLRQGGIQAPVIILSELLPSQMAAAVREDFIQTIFTLERARHLSQTAQSLGKETEIHIKVDTGMGRIGFLPGPEALSDIKAIAGLPNLKLTGIFSHFANSDHPDKSFALGQLQTFKDFAAELEKAGLHIPLRHMANSGAFWELPQSHLEMIRPGIILYGLYPSCNEDALDLDLKPVMSLKALITNIKRIPAQTSVGYSRNWVSQKESLIATVQLGYGDGYLRALSPGACALVEGVRVPVAGNICMDQLMLDISAVPQAKIGSPVVFIGKQGEEEIHLDELARVANTIHYELCCLLGLRLPKIFLS